MKRLLDIVASAAGLLVLAPLLLVVCLLIWLQDYHSPFYVAWRVGRREKKFRMAKLRSMVVRADRSRVDSTAASDPRITPLGRFVRRCKLDEIPQLWNVLKGDMSLVGPRPNVERETALYTPVEKGLLDVRPGITDFASIVFADEGEILDGKADPDLAYNQLIRPWKSRLGLFYAARPGVWLDLKIVFLTLRAVASRAGALEQLQRLLQSLGAEEELCRVAARKEPLAAAPPPGAREIVRSRTVST